MVERYLHKDGPGKVAAYVEKNVGIEWGPEGFKRAEISRALNLPEEAISEAEWTEIYEFAVNAGAEIVQTALRPDLIGTLQSTDVMRLKKRIEKNKDQITPSHDLFHAADIYRRYGGWKSSPRFIEVSPRGRYVDPQAAVDELYAVLFLANDAISQPLSTLIGTHEGDAIIEKFLETTGSHMSRSLRSQFPARFTRLDLQTAEARQKAYEDIVEILVISRSVEQFPDLRPEEVAAMREAFKHPTVEYQEFAKRVFSGEWRTNPRLFLDELLTCIRTQPATHE